MAEATYESKSICIRVLLDVSQQVPTSHPFRNKLEGRKSNTEEWDDVWVAQTLPYYSLLAKFLQVLLNVRMGKTTVSATPTMIAFC